MLSWKYLKQILEDVIKIYTQKVSVTTASKYFLKFFNYFGSIFGFTEFGSEWSVRDVEGKGTKEGLAPRDITQQSHRGADLREMYDNFGENTAQKTTSLK